MSDVSSSVRSCRVSIRPSLSNAVCAIKNDVTNASSVSPTRQDTQSGSRSAMACPIMTGNPRCANQSWTGWRFLPSSQMARLFADWVDREPSFERVAPVPFSVVCFRAVPPGLGEGPALNRFNERLLQALNDTGEVFLSNTSLGGRYVIRLAVGNIRTTEAEVRRTWDLVRELAGRI